MPHIGPDKVTAPAKNAPLNAPQPDLGVVDPNGVAVNNAGGAGDVVSDSRKGDENQRGGNSEHEAILTGPVQSRRHLSALVPVHLRQADTQKSPKPSDDDGKD